MKRMSYKQRIENEEFHKALMEMPSTEFKRYIAILLWSLDNFYDNQGRKAFKTGEKK